MIARGLLLGRWRRKERFGILGEVLGAVGAVEAFWQDNNRSARLGCLQNLRARVGQITRFVGTYDRMSGERCMRCLADTEPGGLFTCCQLYQCKFHGFLQQTGHGGAALEVAQLNAEPAASRDRSISGTGMSIDSCRSVPLHLR